MAKGGKKGETRNRRPVGHAVVTLSINVRALMNHVYKGEANKPLALSKDAHTSLSTIQRVLDAAARTQVPTIEAIASVFRLQPYQLLIEGLNIESPQTVITRRPSPPLFSRRPAHETDRH